MRSLFVIAAGCTVPSVVDLPFGRVSVVRATRIIVCSAAVAPLSYDLDPAQRIPAVVASSLDTKSNDRLIVFFAHDGDGDGVLPRRKILGQRYAVPHLGDFAGRQIRRLLEKLLRK